MELKKGLTEEKLDEVAAIVDNEGFWYALTSGGYLNPKDVLEKSEDVDKVNQAIKIIREFEDLIPQL